MAAAGIHKRFFIASCLAVSRESLWLAVFLLPEKPLGLVIGGF